MLSAYITDLQRGLSADRLAPYRPHGGSDLQMVATYFWNAALCQSLYHSLGALEVSMRNGIHASLSSHFRRTDWYDMPGLLLPREQTNIMDAKNKITRSGKPVIAPRIVAALNYGFWTSILDSAYGSRIWTAKNPAILVQQAFPYAPAHFQVRSRAHRRFNDVRELRNRVFHFEPIWQGVRLANNAVAPVADLHADVIDAIGWVDPALQATIAAFDDFPNVYRNGRIIKRWEIKRHLGIT